jgi:hypothetical protein
MVNLNRSCKTRPSDEGVAVINGKAGGALEYMLRKNFS